MIIDASRGEIQLDDLFNAIEHDKDQVTQALDIYGDYLKVKNNNSINGKNKIELLERILKLECIEKTIVNHNHENERSRINLKWTVLTECGIWYRKLDLYEKAIEYFEKANSINNRVSTIYYEMGMCYLELGNIYQVKICFEKTIEISNEHIHWKCLEQITYLYFILGNFSKCLEYIRIGYDHVATYQSVYDFGQICLVLLEKTQPSMKTLIEKMFTHQIQYIIYDENLLTKVEELKQNIKIFREKLFQKKNINNERKTLDEHVSIESFQDLGQYLVKKIRESNNDNSKLCKLIDINKFLPKEEIINEKPEQESTEQQEQQTIISEEQRSQPTNNRKKRSFLPLNIDDYEKRRSARSITRIIQDDTNVSTVDKLRRILSNDENISDDEVDETAVSPENIDDEIAPSMLSELSKENFPLLQIEYKSFIKSIEQKIQDGYQYHYLDLICDYINELTKHSSTSWSVSFIKCKIL
ncbi:unnamed protein product [Rotaria sp. Silwood2]|nr:unnamed protein product [Rotaria sp. Silwood2]